MSREGSTAVSEKVPVTVERDGRRIAPVQGVKRWMEQVSRRLNGLDRIDVVAPLTLILLMLYAGSVPGLQVALVIVGTAALVYRPLYRQGAFWIGVAAVLALAYTLYWHDADNHKFLITYWCLALGLSRFTSDPEKTLETNARVLVGLCFLLAVLWKLRTPDFLSAEYFQFSLTARPNFLSVAQLVGGLDSADYAQNREMLSELKAFYSTMHEVPIVGVDGIRWLAAALVWWVLAIESLVALGFLWPGDRGPGRWRDAPLLIFVLTTYATAWVPGFAWILIILGLGQVRTSFTHGRLIYLLSIAAVTCYSLDLVGQLNTWLR